jgi:hypothetical protein
MALVDGGLCFRKPFFQAMFFTRRIMELVGLAASITKNLVRMNFEWLPQGNLSAYFNELNGHMKIVVQRAGAITLIDTAMDWTFSEVAVG